MGHVPLPPYIDRPDEEADRQRYQTVFARSPGAVAAPTAGLHFSAEIWRGFARVGATHAKSRWTWVSGRSNQSTRRILKNTKSTPKSYEISEVAAEKIRAKQKVRSGQCLPLEQPWCAPWKMRPRALLLRVKEATSCAPRRGSANLFIVPGYTISHRGYATDELSPSEIDTIALVAAFAGKENVLAAYHHAVEARYRFYSYGDCMLIR